MDLKGAKELLARLKGGNQQGNGVPGGANQPEASNMPPRKASKAKLAEKVVLSCEAMPMLSLKYVTLVREVDELKLDEYWEAPKVDSEGYTVGVRRHINLQINEMWRTPQELKQGFIARYKEMLTEGWKLERSKASDPKAIRILERGH